MKKYIPYYIANLKLALPIVVAQLGQILVQLADSIMVGRWGGEDALPLAAVSFGGQVAMLFFLFALGISMGLTPIVGALVGRGQRENTHTWLFNGLILYLVAGVLLMLLQLACQPLLYHLGQPREVVDAALTYYRIMAYSIPFVMVFATFKQFLEGIGNTWIAMVVLLSANLLNVFFNWLFIYGAWGCQEMGIEGAALATFLARAVGPLAIVLIFLGTRWLRPYIQGWHFRMFSMREMKRLIFIGLPIAGQMFLEAFAFVFTGIMMGWFGTIAISANQIMNTMGNCVFQIVLAMGAATTIRVSHCYGARDYRKMVMSAKAALHMVIIWNILAAVGFVLLRNQIPLLFTSNSEVASLAAVLLVCAATYQFFDGIQNVSIGILRGIHDVKIIPHISFSPYLLLNTPAASLLAFPCGMGAKGLILAYVVGLGATAILCLLRIRRDVRKLQGNE